MKYLKHFVLIALFALFTICFCACDPGEQKNISISGSILCEDVELGEVDIECGTKHLGKTDIDGSFCFITTGSLVTITPSKEGYYFLPRSISISENTDNISFRAIKIYELNGKLSLNSLCITPTSIINQTDNYCYTLFGKNCIKSKSVKICTNDENFFLDTNGQYLYKNEKNYIDLTENISFDLSDLYTIRFCIDAYFTYLNGISGEYYSNSSSFIYFNLPSKITNADLDENRFIYTLYGLNNDTKSYTFNISFIFSYIQD